MGEEEAENILEIHMNTANIPKTAFITPFGTFCHLRMPFGLRNARATFARLVYKVLYKKLGRNVEAYVDDIAVKSRKAFNHASDLQETFNNLRAAGMKLNPGKCVFGVRAGKLLGFLVSERGIEANPEKIDAIQQMKPPSSGTGKFNWTPECQAAFDEIKQYMQSLLAHITSAAVQKFVWKNIVCRFGVPKEFITDNGKQFNSDKFREMCEGLNLEIRFASVMHPQSNGAAIHTNGKILKALKKRLEGAAKGKWPEKILSVLWALRTTPTRPTKFSPFTLLYGDEAMTPTELRTNSPRVTFSGGEEGREVSLELLEGVRVEALEHMRKYAIGTSATYNKKVRPTELLPGHLVLRKKANPIAVGKLESKWEGPYLIKHKSRTGSFRLATLEGEEFDHS
uniref:Retrotransposon protein, putative, Ty3-gypsy subclass n=2 Tax=Oryza sativa subsp. japonica TaxID=39947 RepID=Q8S6A4_ORYSJ|nr:putative polyprotein [Oryza sativa Japonica Group]ABF96863.1 retrotransposon protein, putative, Ty3-gypsy subclass [Oryza sativa Japonica Group]